MQNSENNFLEQKLHLHNYELNLHNYHFTTNVGLEFAIKKNEFVYLLNNIVKHGF